MIKIDEQRRTLEGSAILKSKQLRLKMLLDDIAQNRYRVESILNRLSGTSTPLFVLKQLVKEELISDDQFDKLVELEELDLPTIAKIIRETKIGQGLKFLPKTIGNLTKSLQAGLEELVDTGSSVLKSKLAGVLEELLRRGAITHERYTTIKQDII
jgi:hypothetical protein